MSQTPSMSAWLANKRERSARTCWLGIGALILAHSAVDFLLALSIPSSSDVMFVSFLIGISTAQLGLIALWLVFAARPLISRLLTGGSLIFAMALAFLFGLRVNSAIYHGEFFNWQVFVSTCALVALAAGISTLGFWLLWLATGKPRLALPSPTKSATSFRQIQLGHLFRDIALVCILMTLTRQVIPPFDKLQFAYSDRNNLFMAVTASLANALLALPVIGIGFWPRSWNITVATLTLIVWPAFLAQLIVWTFESHNIYAARHGWVAAALFCAGIIVSLGCTISTLRGIGFEMIVPSTSSKSWFE